uniref:Uncharacterized protein n=1 Tax=Athene cunicularia TaxID=194338 RepID=A0A663LTF6_ATHCN
MCLVFCAFASWAVKTSDLQAPDAWKTTVGQVCIPSFGPAPSQPLTGTSTSVSGEERLL